MSCEYDVTLVEETVLTVIEDVEEIDVVLEVGVVNPSDALRDSFESVAKNINSYDNEKIYDVNGKLTSIVFTTDTGTIVLSFNYNESGKLISKVLSGDIPSGISITKNYIYNVNGKLINNTYEV